MSRIKVLIADDHPLVRQGLQIFLGLCEEIEIVGEASNGEDVLQKAEALKPEIILMDLVMPGLNGNDTMKELKRRGIQSKVLVLTSFVEEDLILEAMRSGASGYLLKDICPSELVEAIKAASYGIPQLHPEVTKMLMQQVSGDKQSGRSLLKDLTDREREVLMLIAKGLTNKEIAINLHVSIKTVKSHVSSIIQKLGVASRTQAALLATKEHMVS